MNAGETAYLWLALSFLIAAVARAFNRPGFAWFLFAVFLSPLIAAVVLAWLGKTDEEKPRSPGALSNPPSFVPKGVAYRGRKPADFSPRKEVWVFIARTQTWQRGSVVGYFSNWLVEVSVISAVPGDPRYFDVRTDEIQLRIR